MSEEIKFEAVFGDQSLFDNAPLGTELVGHSGGFYKNSPDGPIYCGGCTFTTDEYRNIGFIAARRIIRTPTWTKADQLAGKLPEVGAEVIRVDHEDEGCNVIGEVIATWHCAENNESSQTCLRLKDGTLFLVECYSELRPIETPAEKAQRLRDEWINEAINAVRKTDVNGYESIYDALLSGTLSVPTKGGE